LASRGDTRGIKHKKYMITIRQIKRFIYKFTNKNLSKRAKKYLASSEGQEELGISLSSAVKFTEELQKKRVVTQEQLEERITI
jgi:hypothetical protein